MVEYGPVASKFNEQDGFVSRTPVTRVRFPPTAFKRTPNEQYWVCEIIKEERK